MRWWIAWWHDHHRFHQRPHQRIRHHHPARIDSPHGGNANRNRSKRTHTPRNHHKPTHRRMAARRAALVTPRGQVIPDGTGTGKPPPIMDLVEAYQIGHKAGVDAKVAREAAKLDAHTTLPQNPATTLRHGQKRRNRGNHESGLQPVQPVSPVPMPQTITRCLSLIPMTRRHHRAVIPDRINPSCSVTLINNTL